MKKITIVALLSFAVLPFLGIYGSDQQADKSVQTKPLIGTGETVVSIEAPAQDAFVKFVSNLYKDIRNSFSSLRKDLIKLPKAQQLKALETSYEKITNNLKESLHKLQHNYPKFAQKLQEKIRNVFRSLKTEFQHIITSEEARKYGEADWNKILQNLKNKVKSDLQNNLQRFIHIIKPHYKGNSSHNGSRNKRS